MGPALDTPRGAERGPGHRRPRGHCADQPRPITLLQGPIEVGTTGDMATLRYTIETVEGSGAAAERTGPFTATGQRVGEQAGVPTPD